MAIALPPAIYAAGKTVAWAVAGCIACRLALALGRFGCDTTSGALAWALWAHAGGAGRRPFGQSRIGACWRLGFYLRGAGVVLGLFLCGVAGLRLWVRVSGVLVSSENLAGLAE